MAKHFQLETTMAILPSVHVLGGRIEVLAGGPNLTLTTEAQYIGRSPDCHLVLNDPSVSAIHAEVRSTADGASIIDRRSRNGTYMFGRRIRETVLAEMTDLRLGNCAVRYVPNALEEISLGPDTAFGGAIGAAPGMLMAFKRLRQLAKSDISVLITGETGTGKEVVARALHDESARSAHPFVAVNCGEFKPELIESELFGHERGAYTGAHRSREGLIAHAQGGTLFLDEVGDMPMSMQIKMLRVLETGEVRAVGADVPRTVDVRLVFATNVDLEEAIEAERFRMDLFFRIAKARVELPPLRQRLEDIPLLVKGILRDLGKDDVRVDSASLSLLKNYEWPGNVRELKNIVELALATSQDGLLAFHDGLLPAVRRRRRPVPVATKKLSEAVAEFKRGYYLELYSACRGNITHMAAAAGQRRHQLRKEMRDVGLGYLLARDPEDDDREAT